MAAANLKAVIGKSFLADLSFPLILKVGGQQVLDTQFSPRTLSGLRTGAGL